jgi:protein involved in polysaccharide export with SLBB domain
MERPHGRPTGPSPFATAIRRSVSLPVTLALLLAALPATVRAQATEDKARVPSTTAPTLRPGDVLRITVWPNSEFGGEFAIEESGLIYLPFIGSVRAAGVPIEQLRAELRAGYGQAMQSPVVTITPAFRVGIQGQVQRPGIYMIAPTNTLFDVIGMAGGFSRDADQERVRIVREGEVVEVNAFRALQEGFGLNSMVLRSGDQIVVPARPAGFDWRNVLTVIQTVATVALVIDRINR